jgi:hypothetical protein
MAIALAAQMIMKTFPLQDNCSHSSQSSSCEICSCSELSLIFVWDMCIPVSKNRRESTIPTIDEGHFFAKYFFILENKV